MSWSSFLGLKKASEPTPSPEQRAESAFNELSACITPEMITKVRGLYSSSIAVADGSAAVTLARITDIMDHVQPALRRSVHNAETSSGNSYTQAEGIEQLIQDTCRDFSSALHTLHFGFSRNLTPGVATAKILLDSLQSTVAGQGALEK